MSNRADNKVLPHHDTVTQSRRIKLTALSAKIVYVGTMSQYDRNRLLDAVKTSTPGIKRIA